MDFQFDKYQGAGNDFIILDDRTQKFPSDDHDRIKWLCNRNFGIGADGLILIREFMSSGYPINFTFIFLSFMFSFKKGNL